jgi:hypothetical protein
MTGLSGYDYGHDGSHDGSSGSAPDPYLAPFPAHLWDLKPFAPRDGPIDRFTVPGLGFATSKDQFIFESEFCEMEATISSYLDLDSFHATGAPNKQSITTSMSITHKSNRPGELYIQAYIGALLVDLLKRDIKVVVVVRNARFVRIEAPVQFDGFTYTVPFEPESTIQLSCMFFTQLFFGLHHLFVVLFFSFPFLGFIQS